jgi:PPE-repeat protein
MGMTGASGGFGAGIAGVASKFEAEGIKIIAEKTRYNEWEFLYDSARDPLVTGQVQRGSGPVGSGNPGNTVGTPGSQPSGFGSSGSSFGNTGSGFGNSGSGFGNSGFGNSGFGNSGFGNSGSTTPRR